MVEVTKVKAFCPVLIKLACPADVKIMSCIVGAIGTRELAERAGVSEKQAIAFLTAIEGAVNE